MINLEFVNKTSRIIEQLSGPRILYVDAIQFTPSGAHKHGELYFKLETINS